MRPNDILSQIATTEALPVMPDLAIKIIELSNAGELFAEKITAVVGLDPVLSAKLLSAANSSLFPFKREFTDLQQAVALLGADLAMSIVLSIALMQQLRTKEARDGFDHEAFWQKSVLAAVIGNEIASSLRMPNKGTVFISCLLQDIGILGLKAVLGEQYLDVHRRATSHDDLYFFESRQWQLDHAEAGAALLRNWDLPDAIVAAVQASHRLENLAHDPSADRLALITALSGFMADHWLVDTAIAESFEKVIPLAMEILGKTAVSNALDHAIEVIPEAESVFGINFPKSDNHASIF